HQVLTDICTSQGRLSIVKSNPYLRPERRGEWLSIVNASANFLKHADRDPDHILEFRPDVTPMFIIDAVQMYEQIEGRRPFEFNLFVLWFNMKFPALLLSEPMNKVIEDGLAAGVDPNDYETILMLLKMSRDGAA